MTVTSFYHCRSRATTDHGCHSIWLSQFMTVTSVYGCHINLRLPHQCNTVISIYNCQFMAVTSYDCHINVSLSHQSMTVTSIYSCPISLSVAHQSMTLLGCKAETNIKPMWHLSTPIHCCSMYTPCAKPLTTVSSLPFTAQFPPYCITQFRFHGVISA